ncbi:hypothetical protein BWI97_24835 [Siphonobacter sp. BAB-5405]|uniref:right-handed parallel beta-helix repeat-containing protein n=1 Tax=Siphonobacter sp. BAB-5405 TaxID=1864825 RepID=UPI000C803E24|nr:right-handed parallel beta-helix repeat-containing protein [Siphonobacter sp. BAB-5405]PMD89372.1 hypothetical protein BWI97_24835 [Siphonobacter sp. BAB-5405]
MKYSFVSQMMGLLGVAMLFTQCQKDDSVAPKPTTLSANVKSMSLNEIRAISSTVAPDSIYLTDQGKQGLFKLVTTDKKSKDNTGITLVTSNGLRYKRAFSGAANATWFGVSTTDSDIGPELQEAVNAYNVVTIPDGSYSQVTKVILRSNVTIKGNPGKVTLKLNGAGYISFQNFWSEQQLENITIDGINWEVSSTAKVEGSYGPITIDGPTIKNFLVQNCQSIHTSKTANVNWFFLKVSPGKSTDNIIVRNNYARGGRMGVEFLAQRLPQKYLGKNITVSGNRFENCGFGISIAGSFDNVTVDANYLKDCPTYGVEFAGWLHNSTLSNNRFEGKFADLFAGNWENDGDGTIGEGTHMFGNRTIGTCTGKWTIRNGFNMLMENNYINMTGVLDLTGSTNNAQITGNKIISTTENKVIQINYVGNLRFINNYISNENVKNSWLVIIVNGAGATNNLFTNNIIVKSSGGYAGYGNGASIKFYNNYDKDGNVITL